jgi:hypothetical protein
VFAASDFSLAAITAPPVSASQEKLAHQQPGLSFDQRTSEDGLTTFWSGNWRNGGWGPGMWHNWGNGGWRNWGNGWGNGGWHNWHNWGNW